MTQEASHARFSWIQAIRLFNHCKTRAEIAKIVGVHCVVVCDWIRVWKHGRNRPSNSRNVGVVLTIQSVIYKIWRIRIAIRTIGDYMKRWGFTPQKPLKRAYERSPKAVQNLLDKTYPEIKSRV